MSRGRMKLLHYTVTYLAILFFVSTSTAQTQPEASWNIFLEEDLTAQSSLVWVENNGVINSEEAWLSFQSNERLEQPILTSTTNAHYLSFDAEQEKRLSDKAVRISVFAKQAEENPANAFAIAYVTNDTGNSGWRSFRPTADWEEYSFTFTVPKLSKGQGDYLGIAGDFYGTNKATLIRSLKIEVQELTEELGQDESQSKSQENYIVKAGDSLSLISQTVYGDGTLWVDIYEANQAVIENPNVLIVGTELVIPSR